MKSRDQKILLPSGARQRARLLKKQKKEVKGGKGKGKRGKRKNGKKTKKKRRIQMATLNKKGALEWLDKPTTTELMLRRAAHAEGLNANAPSAVVIGALRALYSALLNDDSPTKTDPENLPALFKLTVADGTGSGWYQPGKIVHVTATIPPNKKLARWSGNVADMIDDGTVRMPSADVTIKPEVEPIPETGPAQTSGRNWWQTIAIGALIALVIAIVMILSNAQGRGIEVQQKGTGEVAQKAAPAITTATGITTPIVIATPNTVTDTKKIAPSGKTTSAFMPPDNAQRLGGDKMVGVFYTLNQAGPFTVVTPPESVTIIAAGAIVVDDKTFTTDGTKGNVIVVVCRKMTDCANKVTGYKAGNVGVTTMLPGAEDVNLTAYNAVTLMFKAPNCGSSGCKTADMTLWGEKTTTFTKKPANPADMGITPVTVTTEVALTVPPEGSRPIELNGKIIGHAYTVSGDNAISVPEGGGTILVCTRGCKVAGSDIEKNSVVWLVGRPSDGGTPNDLNWTANVSGDMVNVTMIYTGDAKPFVRAAMTKVESKNVYVLSAAGGLQKKSADEVK